MNNFQRLDPFVINFYYFGGNNASLTFFLAQLHSQVITVTFYEKWACIRKEAKIANILR